MLKLRGYNLSARAVAAAISTNVPITLDSGQLKKVERARGYVEELLTKGEPVYGINTGFGKLSETLICLDKVAELQRNLILSHSCGVGPPLPQKVVKAMIILRANALMRGHSGIRGEVIQSLIDLVNGGVTPFVPSQGSVGASGDLVPLAHMAAVLIGAGQAYYEDKLLPGEVALAKAGLTPVTLEAKEGLALINGTQCMTAFGAHALFDSELILKTADLVSALTMEALEGIPHSLDERVHSLRPHRGQIATARNLRRILKGSGLVYQNKLNRVQDAYSLRCIPQVHGASRDAYNYVEGVLDTEINSVTDNPILFPEDGAVISAGNFHGQPVALALDFLGIALAEIANISERRIERLVNPQLSALPPFLSAASGLNSGYMIIQYTAAALVSENKVLAHPASVDSIPTSANQEDHVSMGSISARKLHSIAANVQNVLAIELLCACQALEFCERDNLAPATAGVYALVREHIPPLKDDRYLEPEIKKMRELIVSGAVLQVAENIVGDLE